MSYDQVEYSYDLRGNLLSKTGSLADTLGTLNPFRYRGYIYDEETGWYYCNSRYYDPSVGRWLNTDAFVSTGQGVIGHNMFAYCGNNPINMVDTSGNWPKWIEDATNWVNENIIQPATSFLEALKGGINNFDVNKSIRFELLFLL